MYLIFAIFAGKHGAIPLEMRFKTGKLKWRYLIGVFVFGMVTLLAFKQENQKFQIAGDAQGTTYHITYYAQAGVISKQQVDSVLLRIDSSLSIYKPYSVISRFNNSSRGCVIDNYLKTVVKKSLEISKATGGISDITVFPLVKAWGFGATHVKTIPDSAYIQSLLPCIGADKIKLVGNRLIKTADCVKIDVNGIAQGYSVDLVADYFESRHVVNYIIEIGGELRVRGRKPDGQMMTIGIESPPEDYLSEQVVSKVIKLSSGAITTSGNYRKYVKSGNKKLSHLIDPKTGFPFQNEMISVTIRAKDGITADGYDNALMGMGLSKSFEFLKHHTELEAYFIYHRKDGSVADTASAGFNNP